MDIRERASRINGKLAELQDKITVAAEDLAATAEDAAAAPQAYRDALDDKIGEARGNVVAAQENMRIAGERAQGKVSSRLLEVQMNVEAAKQQREDRKLAKEKGKAAEQIAGVLDYADYCQQLAVYLVEESHLAALDACALAADYEEAFGEPFEAGEPGEPVEAAVEA